MLSESVGLTPLADLEIFCRHKLEDQEIIHGGKYVNVERLRDID